MNVVVNPAAQIVVDVEATQIAAEVGAAPILAALQSTALNVELNQPASIALTLGSYGASPTTSALTAYDRAKLEDPSMTLTPSEFYARMAQEMMADPAPTSASRGIKIDNGDLQLTLGDGTQNTLVAQGS